jgi:hypothetical protein
MEEIYVKVGNYVNEMPEEIKDKIEQTEYGKSVNELNDNSQEISIYLGEEKNNEGSEYNDTLEPVGKFWEDIITQIPYKFKCYVCHEWHDIIQEFVIKHAKHPDKCCQECIKGWWKENNKNTRCPICRNLVIQELKQIIPEEELQRVMHDELEESMIDFEEQRDLENEIENNEQVMPPAFNWRDVRGEIGAIASVILLWGTVIWSLWNAQNTFNNSEDRNLVTILHSLSWMFVIAWLMKRIHRRFRLGHEQ